MKDNIFPKSGTILLVISAVAFPCFAINEDDRMSQADACSLIEPRINRLSCYDRLFGPEQKKEEPAHSADYPRAWRLATQLINKNPQQNWQLLTEDDSENAWLVLSAQNNRTRFAGNGKPLLLMSCNNNLSRIELVLPQGVEDARIKISIAGSIQQHWRSDDKGVLFSSAQGIPAIHIMKAMQNGSKATVRSNAKFADGLYFDATGLDKKILALRERCQW